MNVLYISELSNLGGGETSLLNSLKEFNKSNYKITPYLLAFEEGKLTEESRDNNIETIILDLRISPKNKKIIRIFKNVIQLKNIIKKKSISVIQTNEWKTSVLISIINKVFKLQCKVIWVCHGQWYKFNSVKRILINSNIDIIIAVSQSVKDNLINNGIKEYIIKKIPLGIDIDYFASGEKGKIRNELKLSDCDKVFGIIGRFQEIKGQMLVVEAAKLLKKNNIKCKFLFIGDSIFGSDKDDQYKKKILGYIKENKLEEYFIFAGVRRDIPNILRDIDALIIPSINESFGMVVIEAFAAGCLVISTPCDGPKEIIKNKIDGIVLSRRDSDELQDYIKKVIANELGIEDIVNRQQEAIQDYKIGVICNKYIRLYNES